MSDTKSPMQELIAELKKRISDRPAPNDVQWGKELGYEFAIDIATSLLAKESELIREGATKVWGAAQAEYSYASCDEKEWYYGEGEDKIKVPANKTDYINSLINTHYYDSKMR